MVYCVVRDSQLAEDLVVYVLEQAEVLDHVALVGGAEVAFEQVHFLVLCGDHRRNAQRFGVLCLAYKGAEDHLRVAGVAPALGSGLDG